MKIPMMQSIKLISEEKKVDKRKLNAINIRKRCLELVRSGARCLDALRKTLKVHRTTLIMYLHEFSKKGLIEFASKGKGGAKIVNVL